jgi:hypothetical protein
LTPAATVPGTAAPISSLPRSNTNNNRSQSPLNFDFRAPECRSLPSAGVRQPGQEYYLEATAIHATPDRYQVIFDLTKHLETRKLELRFPKFEVYVVAFTIDLMARQFKLDVTNEKTGKQVDVEAVYGDSLVHLNAISNILFFPAIDAQICYIYITG